MVNRSHDGVVNVPFSLINVLRFSVKMMSDAADNARNVKYWLVYTFATYFLLELCNSKQISIMPT